MATLALSSDPVPLRLDEHGVYRVGNSRVLLEVVIGDFQNGSSADEIVLNYSTLELPDVYAVIAYYLRHREEVDGYLKARRAEAEELREKIESNQPDRAALRERLLA